MEIAGDGAGAGCSDISGVAVGEELECGGDVSAGGFSFNEDGGCINESKELLAGVGDGVGAGEVAFSCAGVGCVFFDRCFNASRGRQLLRNVRLPSFLWLSVSRRLLEFAVHHHPGFTADNNVVPLTCNMRSRLYLILRCEPGERAITGGVAFGVARPRPRY